LLFALGCTCAGPRTEIPTAHAVRFATPPTLDGALDEWGDATRTEPFVNTMDGTQGAPEASARFGWDDQFLYVAFEIADPFLRSRGAQHDDHLWEEDCAELMIDPDGDGLGYAELQVSPRIESGAPVTFDTWFDSRRQPQPFGHIDWSSGIEAAVHARGTVNDDAADEGYVVEARIPWTAFAIGPHPITSAPRAGDTWRVALYALDARAGEPAPQFGVGWSAPLVGDFHVPDRFGRVVFDP
jgi:hypothetical protein